METVDAKVNRIAGETPLASPDYADEGKDLFRHQTDQE